VFNASSHRFIASSLHRFIASLLHCFIASSLHRFIASSLHRFITSIAQLWLSPTKTHPLSHFDICMKHTWVMSKWHFNKKYMLQHTGGHSWRRTTPIHLDHFCNIFFSSIFYST
jgi:hypothetical protein